jgi:(1->4)-alpha-D-glucan 1-alpha-D-glucosylmutase
LADSRLAGDPAAAARIPRATYRLQLHRGFTFADAERIVPYLAELGVSHVYCSPYLRARSGSLHGYDIIDHGSLNSEIGSEADFASFSQALTRHGLSQMMDVVPNHMAVQGDDNAWWLDVLENGQASRFADFFDIDWEPPRADMAGKVLLPVLGDHYGRVLADGELKLGFNAGDGSFSVHYHDNRFPIDPREYPRVLAPAIAALEAGAAPGPSIVPAGVPAIVPEEALSELKSLTAALAHLPARYENGAASVAERAAGRDVHKHALARLAAAHPAMLLAINGAVSAFHGQGQGDDRPAFDALHELLEAQAWRLAFWRVASDEINYRRFFDINELAALRMEDEAVFEATHSRIFELLRSGAVNALRIDHPDGLFDPGGYFQRLQDRYRALSAAPAVAAQPAQQMAQMARRPPQTPASAQMTSPTTPPSAATLPAGARPLYVVIEKITAPFETLPTHWPVHGTTGYRYANLVNGLFVDTAAEKRFTRVYQAFTGETASFGQVAARARHVILEAALASELMVLSNRLVRIARANRDTRDYTLNTLRRALAEVIVAFPVYRSYIGEAISEQDRRYVEWAVARARRHSRTADASVFDFIRAVLLAEDSASSGGAQSRTDSMREGAPLAALRMFARRFQQLTAPVTAKGMEDTAFYVYNRLVSLNEVGGDPDTFGVTVSAFHGAGAQAATNWPHAMLAGSTHDSKRAEDVRARIDTLSELPAAWRLQLRRWARMNRSKRREVDGQAAPSRNDEYLFYQTLIGSFPLDADAGGDAGLAGYRARLQRYMQKAVREAKVHSSWINPNEDYEAALASFVEAALTPSERNLFLEDVRASLPPVAWGGMLNSLSMTLLKCTSPGVPDTYQGNELLDFSLVDPDNRRPVDFERRRAALAELAALQQDTGLAARLHGLFQRWQDGLPKLYLIWRLLAFRRAAPELFEQGDYTPLKCTGERARHLVAYARRHGNRGLVIIAGRLFLNLGVRAGELPCADTLWRGARVELPFLENGATLRNILTGEVLRAERGTLRASEAFAHYPGAALEYRADVQ